jgi:serine/threonine protein kinase
MAQRDSRLVGGIYRMGQVIVAGGMLTTCTAYNHITNDVVGLFIIEAPPYFDARTIQQLLQPFEQRRAIDSPHVIHLYDLGLDGSRVYIATDPPRGVTLRYVLDHENIDFRRSLELMLQMTVGVKALHEHGISKLDLRPQLITVDSIVVEDRVQLDDIGLRAMLRGMGYVASDRPDDIGFLDPRYASPELIGNGMPGPASDIYQLGLLFFELITGRLPFVGRNPAETGVMQNTEPVPRLTQFKHDAPSEFQEIIDRALVKNPAMRYASAADLLAALSSLTLSLRRGATEVKRDEGPSTRPGMTREMLAMEKDLSLESTAINPLRAANEPSGVYGYLCFEKDGKEVQRFPITKTDVIVGRTDPKRGLTPDIDLTSLDPNMTVSRQHGRIRYEGTFFYIEDLKSRNKTRLGELSLVPLKPELLQHGDAVSFGAVHLIFKIPGQPDVAPIKDR